MDARRTVIVVGALLAAAVAAFANFAYLNTVQERANHRAELVEVFVVRTDIAKGFSGDEALAGGQVKTGKIQRDFRPGAAITTGSSIKGKVALGPLSAGQVVTAGMFVDPTQVTGSSFASRILDGNVAVTIQVDQVRGVAGLLVPGDFVNILVREGATARYLYQHVKILAIGTSAAPQAGDATAAVNPGSGLITFEVPSDAAAKIALASSGDLYLTLVPPNYKVEPIAPIGSDDAVRDTP